jgi:integrase
MFGASRYLHPGRYDSDTPISNATLNRVIDTVVERIRVADPDFQSFGVHDLHRTFSTGLNRAKFDDRWIEMSLAHAPRNRIAAVYNVNRYLAERKIMLQCWADMLDAWAKGESAKDLIAELNAASPRAAAKRRAAEVHDDELDDDL